MIIFDSLFPARLKPDGIRTLRPSEVVCSALKLLDRRRDPALDHGSVGFGRRARTRTRSSRLSSKCTDEMTIVQ